MARGVYLVGNVYYRFYKVGRTTNLKNRLKNMTDCPFEVKVFHFWETPEDVALEAFLHNLLKKRNAHSEMNGSGWNLKTSVSATKRP